MKKKTDMGMHGGRNKWYDNLHLNTSQARLLLLPLFSQDIGPKIKDLNFQSKSKFLSSFKILTAVRTEQLNHRFTTLSEGLIYFPATFKLQPHWSHTLTVSMELFPSFTH